MLVAELAEAEVCHDSSDHRVSVKTSALLQVECAYSHHLVAVNKLAVFVDRQTSVCISVKRNSAIVAALNNKL